MRKKSIILFIIAAMIVIPAASCKNNEFEAGVDIKDTSGTAIEGPNANIQDSGSTDTVKDPDDTDDNSESSTDDTFSSVSAEESSSDEVSDDVYIPESSDEESNADQISIESEPSEISTVHESSSSTDHSSTESSVDTVLTRYRRTNQIIRMKSQSLTMKANILR